MKKTEKKLKREKSKFRINLEYYPVWFAKKVVDILPLGLCYNACSVVFACYYIFFRKHRIRTMQHLLHAGICDTPKAARKMAWRNFMEFSKTAVEMLKIGQLINQENCTDKIKLICSDAVRERFFNPGNSENAIIVTCHSCNWEISAIAYSEYAQKQLMSVRRRMSNPKLDALFYERNYDQHTSCEKKGAVRPLMKMLRKKQTIALLVDQHASTKEGGVITTFFGQPARTHITPARIHLKTKVPIIVFVLRRTEKRGYYELIVNDPIEIAATGDDTKDIAEITKLYTAQLEGFIREKPEEWLWAHRRWININRKTPAVPQTEQA
jgi:Kdo2-lipid IVA lauroyltransferase/acyltransferase